MTSQSTSRDFTDRVISQFLYGQDEAPEKIANEELIRPVNARTAVIIDVVDYINNGPGRLAMA